MATLTDIRAQHPEYRDLSDQQLADGLYAKFYSDMPRSAFDAKVGLKSGQPLAGAQPGSREYADWAASQARAGKALPTVGPQPSAPNVGTGPLDQIQAGYTSAVNAFPIAGPKLLEGVQNLRSAFQGQPLAAIQSDDMGREAANPTASTVGSVAGTVLPFMAGGAIPGVGRALGMTGGLMSRIGLGGLSGAAISGADTLARGGSADDARTSALTGGALGAAFPLAGAGLRRLASPFVSTGAQRGAAQVMDQEGVTLTAGQRTGSKKLKYLESELGGGAADAIQEQQARQFTRAALRRAGVDADSVEPQVMDQAFGDLGQRFDALASRTTVPLDTRLQNDLLRTVADYNDVAGNPARIVERMMNRIGELAQNGGGALTGEAYQNIRSEIGRLTKAADGPTGQALRDLQSALDDAVGRHMPAQFRQAWAATRRQYQNLLVIEKAATGAGDQAASGIITPARLRSAAIAQNRRAFARGRNDFTDLANAAVQTMTPLPQSGTAPRLAARAFGAIPAALGGLAGAPAGIAGAAAGALAGAAIPAAVGRAVLSAPGRALLSNQVFAGPAGRALIAPAVPGALADRREPIHITVGR